MKKLTKLLAVLLVLGIMVTGCNNQIKPSEPDKIPVESNEGQENPDNQANPEDEPAVDKDLKQVNAIFYSMDADKADMIILDSNLDSNLDSKEITLKDEARVFLTDKEVNTVVSLQIKESSKGIEVYNAKDADKATAKAKYIGFADNNFAEFEIMNKAFVLQIPEALKTELEKVNTNELLEITIKTNEIPIANPVLESFKRGQ